ncbi:hypothetical protein, partial [Streptomyces griseus]
MVRSTLVNLGPKVLAGRMVREYVERLYAPATHRARPFSSYVCHAFFSAHSAQVPKISTVCATFT